MTDIRRENNKRIAKNTFYLYLRTFLTMAISIYTSRVVLNTLGINDFGIYNIVGGFVSLFSLLSGTLTAATQRFISFELGKKEPDIKRIFSASISIHTILALIVFIVLESVGLWFLNNKMNIEPERLYAANWVFQCSILTFCINLLSIPYNAAIIAYEKMNIFAYISIFEASSKLMIVYLLVLFNYDKLIIYSILMLIIALILRVIYGFYCNKKIKDCIFHFIWDKPLYNKMLSFSSWNFIGSSASILNTQGINILINLFFGVVFNAARGIAEQVNTALNSFVINFMTALNPQITKNFASGNYSYMNTLIINGARYSFFLSWIISLPIILEVEPILKLWLVNVPNYATTFVRYALVFTLCQSLSQTLYIAMLATGNIRKYQLVVGTLSSLAFPVAYILYYLGFSPEWGYISSIVFSIVSLIARLVLLRNMIPCFSIKKYLIDVILKVFSVVVISSIILFFIKYIIHSNGFVELIFIVTLSFIIVSCTIYILGLNNKEKKIMTDIMKRWYHNLKNSRT